MKSTISAKAIQNLITSDINACNLLLQLLDQEQEALAARDTDALANIVEQKMQPLAHLDTSAKKRHDWSLGMPGELASKKWNAIIEEIGQSNVKKDWEKLKNLTKECQQKNETNGKILARHQQIYGRLFELIRGQTTSPNLYTASGTTTGKHHSFKLDQA